MLIESRPENCGDVIEVDQTAPLNQILDGSSVNDEIRNMFVEYGELSGTLRKRT